MLIECMPFTKLKNESQYRALGQQFTESVATTPLQNSRLLDVNPRVVEELKLNKLELTQENWRALANGELKIGGGETFSSYYSGHQFGVWAGQLGDGRAHILGEVNGFELQLKGAGLTPFSRMGDGKAVLRSTIREYLAGEAMWALGIPTTRSLVINGSSEPVRRERIETAATMIRVSPSFIRFGTFEHFKSKGDESSVSSLVEYVGRRYFQIENAPTRADEFLDAVCSRTAFMIAQWMAYGFCHGVMNTDNMSILGLTLDYGPYGFLDLFEPNHICNHTDEAGRYAYLQQPTVAHWNLLAFAYSISDLVPFEASEKYLQTKFADYFKNAYWDKMCARLALPRAPEGKTDGPSENLIQRALEKMVNVVEYNRFFYELIAENESESHFVTELVKEAFWRDWLLEYRQLHDPQLVESARKLNPRYVLKNWVAQDVIDKVEMKNDASAIRLARELFQNPTQLNARLDFYAGPTPPAWQSLSVSCSS